MRDYLTQNLVHALLAAGVVEALLRQWRVGEPDERLRFRLLALILPLIVLPGFAALAPFRLERDFAEGPALFASRHWARVELFGVPVDMVVLALAAAAGVVLYARDLWPAVGRGRRRRPETMVATRALIADVAALSGTMGLTATPTVRVEPEDESVLLAVGGRRPMVIVSHGALSRLQPAELRAVLAHELAHLVRDDPRLGWTVMLARTVLIFNPIAQLVGRGVVLELERRADDEAVRVTGDAALLARAMVALVREQRLEGRPPGVFDRDRGLVGELVLRGRRLALERRCRRLLEQWPPVAVPLRRLRLATTGIALAAVMFFVV